VGDNKDGLADRVLFLLLKAIYVLPLQASTTQW
jgi:hypothetical protein